MHKYILIFFLIVATGALLSGCGKSNTDARGAESFLVSIDGGKIFAPRVTAGEKSIAGITVLSMVRSAKDAKTMYLGTRKNGIFVTHDGGGQWQQISFPPERIYGIAVDTQDSTVLYATGVHSGGFARIYKSVDSGENWNEIYSEPTKSAVITSLAMDPKNPQVLYIGTSKGVIIKTTDGGASWANIYNAKKAIIQIVFDAQDTQTVYFALHESGLLKTRNGGEKVENFTKKLAGTDKSVIATPKKRRSTRVYSLQTDPHASGIVYIGTDTGVYRSSDYGVTWNELNVIGSSEKLPVKVIAINPHNTNEIVYSVARTLYHSSKNMTEWTPVQISSSRVASVIQYDPVDEGTLYIGMASNK